MNFSDIADQTIIFGVPAFIIAIVGYFFKVTRPAKKERDERNDAVYELIAGRKPTELEPSPPKGLAEKVDAIANQPDVVSKLADDFVELRTTVVAVAEDLGHLKTAVAAIDSKTGSVASGVAELVFDKGTNGGSTGRDTINRIEEKLGTKPVDKNFEAETHDEQGERHAAEQIARGEQST